MSSSRIVPRSSFALVLIVAGCGGSAPSPTAPGRPAEAPKDTAAERCLAEAAAPREPRADAPEKIAVSHILVRHRELARPEGATRSRGEACLRAQAARDELLAGGEWDAVFTKYGDAGQATSGKLGRVSKGELDATFANAAFALDAGELSHVVETERGFHVIARTE